MSPFRLAGLDPAPFEPLFLLDDAELDARGIVRRFADADRGFHAASAWRTRAWARSCCC